MSFARPLFARGPLLGSKPLYGIHNIAYVRPAFLSLGQQVTRDESAKRWTSSGARPGFSSRRFSSQEGQDGARRGNRSNRPFGRGLGKRGRIGKWMWAIFTSWKKRHDTLAWQRHIEQFRGKNGERCFREVQERIAEARARAARYIGALKAGAPRKPNLPPVGRQLTAYLAPASQRQRSLRPQHHLALIEAPFVDVLPNFGLALFRHMEALSAAVVAGLAGIFKSSDVLSRLNLLTRITFSLLPITLALRFKAVRVMRRYGAQALNGRYYPSRAFTLSLVVTPFVLLGLAYLISLEATPITGRTRSLFVSDGERSEIVRAFVGERATATEEDWFQLLRRMLGDEAMGTAAGSLLGGQRLASSDWRVELVQDTLRSLEAGVPGLGAFVDSKVVAGLAVPDAFPPLENASPAPQYRVLVIDRLEPNAFSCGFAPIGQGIGPGVIVVFKGVIDLILGSSTSLAPQSCSQEQREDLAVLLSHELAHLLCSHTLEQHASDLQRPQIRKILADAVRTIVYQVTFILGPFVQDAISASLTTGFNDFHGVSSSCESRLHETEADSVSLRILANAGFDPRISLRYWQDRLSRPLADYGNGGDPIEGLQWHSKASDVRAGFLRTHPVDADRLKAIRNDLARWKEV